MCAKPVEGNMTCHSVWPMESFPHLIKQFVKVNRGIMNICHVFFGQYA